MVKKTITVFTPAYNRAHTLIRTYNSLLNQTCKDFEWLIIDDGSIDNTNELVQKWILDDIIQIRYIYQKNQGMHGAHNTAYKNICTELNICIDSDDYMPKDAIEKIVHLWSEKGSQKVAGIVGLDYTTDGDLIGTKFPEGKNEITLSGFYSSGGLGDKKLVYRTEVIKQYPDYPVFEGEKYFSLGYKYLLIDQDYSLLALNEPLVIVEYQLDGSSYNMYRQYWNNPNGFMFLRKEHMKYYQSIMKKFKSGVHYVSHCLRARRFNELLATPCPVLTFAAIPFGVFLYFFTWSKVRSNKRMSIH